MLGGSNTTSTNLSSAVSVSSAGSITTYGINGIGIMAQSVAGGGGISSTAVSGGSITLNPSVIGGQTSNGIGSAGNALAVTINQTGAINTSGPSAMGIVAQSVGGGGGYASLASQSSTSVINGGNITIGGSSNSSGNGGAVNVTVSAPITTTGIGSVGVVAQSVGGGGGILATSGITGIAPIASGGTGNGGAVSVVINAPITASGAGAYGVVAQSVGGGGGMMINENGVTDISANAGGNGGSVSVVDNSTIVAIGGSALGIYAKSLGGSSDPDITIAKGASAIALNGGTAVVVDGLINSITNNGSISVNNIITDTAIEIHGAVGATQITNSGFLSGQIKNPDSSRIGLANLQGAQMYLPNSVSLGGGLFTNAGYLQFSQQVGGISSLISNGAFTQVNTGELGLNLDINAGVADQLNIAAGTTFNLSGNIRPILLNAGLIAPGSVEKVIVTNNGGALNIDHLGVDYQSAILSFAIQPSANEVTLKASANFAPTGLSPYASQIGSAIGAYQTAGSNTFFQAATAQLVTIPTVSGLDQAYNSLAGAAIQAAPQVTYQAVTRAVGTVSDRMNSWRVGDSFITTTKNPRALMTGIASMNAPITPNAPQVANGTLPADAGELPLAQMNPTDYRTWVAPFGGNSNSNNLADQIYGGSLGIEKESDDRQFIGGAAMTISQSNYTYSSSTTPATPGTANNYGASAYFGARNESAYLSAIAYLGGSNGSFNRQLQALGFDTSTNVNVHSNIMAARVEAGYNLFANPEGQRSLQLTPFVAIQPTQIRQDGANEYFNGLGSGFYYGSNLNTAMPLYLGAELSGDMDLGDNEILRPFLRVSWAHDLMSAMTMNAAYSPSYGVSLYANGTPTMGNSVIIKGGAKYNWGSKVSAYATIDVEQGNAAYSYRGIGGTVGAIYSW